MAHRMLSAVFMQSTMTQIIDLNCNFTHYSTLVGCVFASQSVVWILAPDLHLLHMLAWIFSFVFQYFSQHSQIIMLYSEGRWVKNNPIMGQKGTDCYLGHFNSIIIFLLKTAPQINFLFKNNGWIDPCCSWSLFDTNNRLFLTQLFWEDWFIHLTFLLWNKKKKMGWSPAHLSPWQYRKRADRCELYVTTVRL